MIVLDTHTLVWWVLTPERLSAAARDAIKKAGCLGVPSIAFWEVTRLVRLKRLHLDVDVVAWAKTVLSIPRITALFLTPEIAIAADGLAMHGDPADRFIVATAMNEHAPLVTKDDRIRSLDFVLTIW